MIFVICPAVRKGWGQFEILTFLYLRPAKHEQEAEKDGDSKETILDDFQFSYLDRIPYSLNVINDVDWRWSIHWTWMRIRIDICTTEWAAYETTIQWPSFALRRKKVAEEYRTRARIHLSKLLLMASRQSKFECRRATVIIGARTWRREFIVGEICLCGR